MIALVMTAAGAYGSAVNCNNNSADAALIQNAVNRGGVVTISGTCVITSAVNVNNAVTINGSGNPNLNGSGLVIVNVFANNVTINGITFNGGKIYVGLYPATNFVFTNNTMQNVTSNWIHDVLHIEGIANSTISGNTFLNLWATGYPHYPGGTNPGDDLYPNAIHVYNGMSNSTISNNVFNEIGNDALSVQANGNNGSPLGGPNNVISYNEFIHVHRAGLEMQVYTPGLVVKGNYFHDAQGPFWNSWGYSLAIDGSANITFVNNTGTTNSNGLGCYGFLPAFLEAGGSPYLVQGNVATTVYPLTGCVGQGGDASQGSSWKGVLQGAAIKPGIDTNIYQNNIFCGSPYITSIVPENTPRQEAIILDRYNYKQPNGCPAGTALATSNIVAAFASSNNQSFLAGGSGTWNMYVISNLSIKYVQFFIDGSSTPVVTQEIQDANVNFANDRKWLYHATVNTSGVAAGNHTITAKATDVSGATQRIVQNFVVGSGGAPKAQVTPLSISFGSQTLGLTASVQTTGLRNSGTAPLTVSGVSIEGANAADFSQTTGCGSSLPTGASCTLSVTFTPSVAGARTATLSITDNDSGSPQTVLLSGTGVMPLATSTSASTSLPKNLPTGMILWLASDAGTVTGENGVTAWDDQSGNGNNAVQPNAANQPILVAGNCGQSALRFNGSSSFMSIPSLPINGNTGLTVFLVSANSTDHAAGYGQYAFLYWPETGSWGSSFFGSYQTSSHFRFGTLQTGNEPSYQMAFNRTNSFSLSEWMHSGPTDSMWLNGQITASYTGKVQAINGVGNAALLGQGINNTFYAGDISEVIVYGRGLSTSERQAVEKYLMSKYHL
jgi:hypothetical protein